MRRLALALLLMLTVVPTPATATTSYVDRACKSALHDKKPWLSKAQLRRRCTVHSVYTGGHTPNSGGHSPDYDPNAGFAGWDVGNAVWSFNIAINYHRVWTAQGPFVFQWVWVIDNVSCVVQHVYLVTLDIKDCPSKGWRLASDLQRAGAFYETSYAHFLVTQGQHSYRLFTDNGSVSDIVQGSN